MSDATKGRLSYLDAVNIIVGSMIGSGIFLVTAKMATQVQTPWLVLAVWLVTGVWIVLGALTYGELGAMFPQAGGLYVYLKEAFGRPMGFLYGWSFIIALQTGTIAAVAVAFAKFLGVFWGGISSTVWLVKLFTVQLSADRIYEIGLNTQNLVGILCLVALTLVNLREIKTGATVQNVFTFTKTGALVVVMVLGVVLALRGQGSWDNLASVGFVPASGAFTDSLFILFGAAMVGSVFSASAWEYVTFVAGEMQNPKRNLPRALVAGTSVVIVIYLLVNLVYFYFLPIGDVQAVAEGRVGTLLLGRMLGPIGESLMAALILVSIFGCLNGLIFSGARVNYAMAKDGLFFRQAAKLNKHGAPAWVLWAQCGWASLLCLTGSYSDLLGLTTFVMVVFYLLTAAGVLRLRGKRPHTERPVKVWGYPYIPLAFVAMGFYIGLTVLIDDPVFAGGGLVLILVGIPIYRWFERTEQPPHPPPNQA